MSSNAIPSLDAFLSNVRQSCLRKIIVQHLQYITVITANSPYIRALPEMIGHKLPCTPDENVWAKLGYDRFQDQDFYDFAYNGH